MAIDEAKLQAIIDEQQDRIEALENFCAYVAMGMLMVLSVTVQTAIETGVIEEPAFDKQKIDEAMNDYLKNVRPAGSA